MLSTTSQQPTIPPCCPHSYFTKWPLKVNFTSTQLGWQGLIQSLTQSMVTFTRCMICFHMCSGAIVSPPPPLKKNKNKKWNICTGRWKHPSQCKQCYHFHLLPGIKDISQATFCVSCPVSKAIYSLSQKVWHHQPDSVAGTVTFAWGPLRNSRLKTSFHM